MSVDTGWHFHDMHQLLYAFEGAIEVQSARGRHLIPRQLAAWIPAGAAHRTSIHQVRSGSVFFPPEMIADAGGHVRTVLVSTLMREMIRESMRWPFQQPECAVSSAFFKAMAGLCVEWVANETDLFLPTCTDPRLKRALEYTNKHTDADLSLVCLHAGMSERSLRRHLKAEIGMTWESYRRRSRLLRAVSLLSDTDVPVGDVATRCGFESQSAFAKAFRVAMGETPRDYRNRVRETAGDG
jgi:AraC-like DNA-binding protein